MSVSSAFDRLAEYYRRHGLRSTVKRARLAARRISANRMVLFYCDVSTLGRSKEGLPGGLEVERKTSANQLSPSDLNDFLNVWNPGLARRQMDERFRLGSSLWLAKRDGALAGYGWSLRGGTVEPHYFPLGQNDVHLFDFTVFERYRGRGINPLLVTSILHRLAADGADRAFIEAAEWNRAQLSSLGKTPFRRLGCARKSTILGQTFVHWAEEKTQVQEKGPVPALRDVAARAK